MLTTRLRRAHPVRIRQLRLSHHFSVHNKGAAIGSASPTLRCPVGLRRGIVGCLVDSRLEQILQRELGDASGVCTRKLSECSVANTGIHAVEIRMVEEVEEFAAELDLPKFVNRKFLEQREVHVYQAGTIQHTP